MLRFTLLNSQYHTTALWEMSQSGTNAHPLLPGWNNPSAECCGSWTADGGYFVFQSTRDGSSNLWQIDERPGLFSSRRPVQITNGPLSYQAPITSRDGDRIFFIGLDTRSELLSYDARSSIFIPNATFLSNARRVEFSRDQKWVAWIQQDDGSLWRSRLDGSQRVELTAKPMQVFMMHWSPDGRQMVVMDASRARCGSSIPWMLRVGTCNRCWTRTATRLIPIGLRMARPLFSAGCRS